MIEESFEKKLMPEGYISAHPIPSEEDLAKFYKELYYQQTPSATYQQSYTAEEIRQKILRSDILLESLLDTLGIDDGQGRKFLEVGCGEGFVLQSAHRRHYQVRGLDFSDFGVKKFHPNLVPFVEAGDAYQLLDAYSAKDDRFDVCVLQNVLEHVIDPVLLLSKMSSIIKPDGLIALTVPNDFSRIQQKAQELGYVEKQYWFCPPQHLHYFNTESLRKFLAENKFEILDSYGDFPIEMFTFHPGSNYSKDPTAGKGAHHARVQLDLLLAENGMMEYLNFCRALVKCGMGRNVTMVARKR